MCRRRPPRRKGLISAWRSATASIRLSVWFLRAKACGWIKYATALDEVSFADAPLMTDFRYRDGHGTNDIDKGWVWLTVPVPDERPASTNRLWKIYVDDTADATAQN